MLKNIQIVHRFGIVICFSVFHHKRVCAKHKDVHTHFVIPFFRLFSTNVNLHSSINPLEQAICIRFQKQIPAWNSATINN